MWTVVGILLPLLNNGYYTKFSDVPIFTYSQSFYDGASYNESSATEHPFAATYKQESTFFNEQSLVIKTLIVILTVQIIFWFVTIGAYVYQFKLDRNKNSKIL